LTHTVDKVLVHVGLSELDVWCHVWWCRQWFQSQRRCRWKSCLFSQISSMLLAMRRSLYHRWRSRRFYQFTAGKRVEVDNV